MWSADPFMPTPGQFSSEPESLGGDEAQAARTKPEAKAAAPSGLELDPDLPPANAEPHAAAPASDEFTFDSPGPSAPPSAEEAPSTMADWSMPAKPDQAAPAEPAGDTTLGWGGAASGAEEKFPGDEPTAVLPMSAALLDKMRERDQEAAAQQQAAAVEGGRTAAAEPAPAADETASDLGAAAAVEEDPDEAHWRETFDQFKALKEQLGEPADKISFEKFAAKLKKNRSELVARHNCRGVRFSVYEKDGKAAIKASAIR